MTRQQAIKEGRKRWGAKASLRVRDKISSPEMRATASAATAALRARKEAIDAEVKARLAATDWYVALQTERRQIVATLQGTEWGGCYYKFSVGETLGIGTHIYGQGDTWEEAFRKADDYAERERERYATRSAATNNDA